MLNCDAVIERLLQATEPAVRCPLAAGRLKF
jgi:hypothetical protein